MLGKPKIPRLRVGLTLLEVRNFKTYQRGIFLPDLTTMPFRHVTPVGFQSILASCGGAPMMWKPQSTCNVSPVTALDMSLNR